MKNGDMKTLNRAPEHVDRGYLTEKVDVYEFGLLLFELLSGQELMSFCWEREIHYHRYLRIEMLINALHNGIRNEGIDQFQDFETLILKCTSFQEEERPTMIEVAKELRRIDKFALLLIYGGILLMPGTLSCPIVMFSISAEEIIAFCNDRSNPIRHFSAKELLRAINNFDARQIFVRKGRYTLYKGSLKDRPIFVKKYCYGDDPRFDFAFKDIAIGSQMSVHKNVLKVLGLETKIPPIVYEFAGTEILSPCISAADVQPLSWKCRLKIAIGIVDAVAYLHNAFSRPVIHREIDCSNIILDQNNVPKL
ncbi:Kinase superfamily protein [Theobroma cacao]|uniref:Kinase superfamily protein n=1 Tax=Theobroma cacao TaxID=3641 RepID=A0A061F312_THECC|nr:Kinase superfamily protein [Theobroma cacao]